MQPCWKLKKQQTDDVISLPLQKWVWLKSCYKALQQQEWVLQSLIGKLPAPHPTKVNAKAGLLESCLCFGSCLFCTPAASLISTLLFWFRFSYFLSHHLLLFLFLSSHSFQNCINKEKYGQVTKLNTWQLLLGNTDATIAAEKWLYYIIFNSAATIVSFAYRASHCITPNPILSVHIYADYFLVKQRLSYNYCTSQVELEDSTLFDTTYPALRILGCVFQLPYSCEATASHRRCRNGSSAIACLLSEQGWWQEATIAPCVYLSPSHSPDTASLFG